MSRFQHAAAGPAVDAGETGSRKRTVRTFRFLLLLAVMGTAYPAASDGGVVWQFWLACGLLFASNVAYHFDRTEMFSRFRISALLFLFDLGLLGFMMALLGERSQAFFALAALTVLMAAITRSVGGAVVSTVAVGTIYTTVTLLGRSGVAFLSVTFLTRGALLFVLSLFVTYLARETERARHAARHHADLYRGLFDMSPAWTFVCDRGGRILQVNPAATSALGYGRDGLLGLPLDEVVSLPSEWRDVEACRRDGRKVESLAVRVLRRDGTGIPCHAMVSAVPVAGDTLLFVQAHERQRELTHLRRAVARAERRVAVGRLMGVASHELNNILTTVLGYAQLAASRDLDPEALSEIRQVESGALVATRVVRNLTVFSRIRDAGLESFALNPVVAGVLELKVFELRRHGIRVEWVPDPDLPPALGDPYAMALVVLNVVDFAQHNIEQAGGTKGRIRVRTLRTEEGLAIAVDDNGAALPPTARHSLFDAEAVRPESDDRPDLYVCRSILKHQGGDLLVEDGTTPGTVLRVLVPAAERAAAEGGRADSSILNT